MKTWREEHDTRSPVIVDRAVWDEVTERQVGIKWDSGVEKV